MTRCLVRWPRRSGRRVAAAGGAGTLPGGGCGACCGRHAPSGRSQRGVASESCAPVPPSAPPLAHPLAPLSTRLVPACGSVRGRDRLGPRGPRGALPPTDGWLGFGGRRPGRRAAGFSRVVRWGPLSAQGAAAVALLLDAASHGGPAGRWALLCPSPKASRTGSRCGFDGATIMCLRARASRADMRRQNAFHNGAPA